MQSIRDRRHTLRRPAFGVVPKRRWTNEEDTLLGTMSDRDLAQRLSRGLSAVANRRLNKRISPFR